MFSSSKNYKREIKITALLILILVINSAFQINIYKNFSKNSPLQKDFPEFLKSAYYNIGPIYINDDDLAQDWAYHASHYPWCTGSGTENDPYIIDNVYIDAGGVGNCIRIIYSDVYFIIQNSILNNSGVNGIDLDYANNGRIQNNTFSYHGQRSIEWGPSHNITIHNNTFSNNYRGIRILSFCHNVIITNNIFSSSVDYNIYLTYAYDGRISHNLIDNGQIGINLYECKRYNITDNIVRNIVNEGIVLVGSDDDLIVSNNILTNNLYGIRSSSTDNIFYNNTATSNSYGMSIGGVGNQVINNSLSSNSIGLGVYGGGKYVSHNNISLNGRGIYLTGSGNNFTGNIVNDNSQDGMYISNSDGNYIYQNSFSHNGDNGIYMEGGGGICENNKIIQNEINDNSYSGIYLWDYCEYNEIYGNNISSNQNSGIVLFNYCDWNNISSNYIFDNYLRGLWFVQRSDNNIVFNNTILGNRNVGVRMQATNYYNNFSSNIIENNFNIGISIEIITCSYNLFYNNYFINNLVHVSDAGFINYWNSSSIGNYWDDNLLNIDINDDGIGEYPYNITLSPLVQDFLPIFDDGDDPAPPIISIVNPVDYQITGKKSPSFQISIDGLHVHTKWYEIVEGSKNITFVSDNGVINQTLWDEFGNGTVTLRFHVNDTLGYGTSDEVTIRKDIIDPQLAINSPIDDTLFGNTAPIFNVEISDPNLDTSWYSLDGGLTNFIFTTNSSINQTLWESTPDGQVLIGFYVNDTAGNLIFDSVTVRKDTNAPVITITSPNPYDLFGNPTINFNVEISDLNLEKMWYTIAGSLSNITFISNGTIDAALWNSVGSGDLTLVFYANDTHGRISTDNVIITKDITPPSVSIINPTSGETFYVTPPEFEITVSDVHLELVWYTIDGGITNISITLYTDFIDQNAWAAASQGDIIIRFYARDSLGNIAYSEVIIHKESVSQRQPPPGIPGFDVFVLIGIISIISTITILRRSIKKKGLHHI